MNWHDDAMITAVVTLTGLAVGLATAVLAATRPVPRGRRTTPGA
jgi:hypothetical protein